MHTHSHTHTHLVKNVDEVKHRAPGLVNDVEADAARLLVHVRVENGVAEADGGAFVGVLCG